MKQSWEQYGRRVLSGRDRSARAVLLRGALAAVEPLYAALITGRNLLYDAGGFSAHRLVRPVVSVGNITAGGTGKTPVVRWLAERLRDEGRRPAVLLRGYKLGQGVTSDEQLMLDCCLNSPRHARIPVEANPSRALAAQRVLEDHPEVDVFILDDAFQHRQVARDFDLVLINVRDPFGYRHVHPRGLLREPLHGLGRADAFLLTRADQATQRQLSLLIREIRRYNRHAPIYRSNHAHVGLHSPDASAADPPDRSLDDLGSRRYFVFSGIGNPDSLHRQFESLGGSYVGRRWFPDHYEYTEEDLAELREQAAAAGADLLVTTEKDWVKIERFDSSRQGEPPIWRMAMEIRFWNDDASRLLDQIRRRIGARERGLSGRRREHPEAQRNQGQR